MNLAIQHANSHFPQTSAYAYHCDPRTKCSADKGYRNSSSSLCASQARVEFRVHAMHGTLQVDANTHLNHKLLVGHGM
jgi:hypothetical protein